jgi:hypothetical protein
MTNVEIEQLGRQMWRAGRSTTDPVLRSLFQLVHMQTVNLRKWPGGVLHQSMMRTLRDLEAAITQRTGAPTVDISMASSVIGSAELR